MADDIESVAEQLAWDSYDAGMDFKYGDKQRVTRTSRPASSFVHVKANYPNTELQVYYDENNKLVFDCFLLTVPGQR